MPDTEPILGHQRNAVRVGKKKRRKRAAPATSETAQTGPACGQPPGAEQTSTVKLKRRKAKSVKPATSTSAAASAIVPRSASRSPQTSATMPLRASVRSVHRGRLGRAATTGQALTMLAVPSPCTAAAPARAPSKTPLPRRTPRQRAYDGSLRIAQGSAMDFAVLRGVAALCLSPSKRLLPVTAATTSASATHARPVRYFIVEPNAYHGTFVHALLTSRGPEWRAVVRHNTRLTAAEIEICAFVWFKYEHIRDVPEAPPCRLDAPLAAVADANLRAAYKVRLVSCADSSAADAAVAQLDPLANLAPRAIDIAAFARVAEAAPRLAPPPAASPQRVLHYQSMPQPPVRRLMSCFHDASAVWRKHRLYRCLKAWCDAAPAARGSVRERMPVTFPVSLEHTSRDELVGLMRAASSAHGITHWLAKATGGANGNGIVVSDDAEKVADYVLAQPRKGSPEGDWWVVQEFLTRLPLIGNRRRFQVKVHCLTVATPVGYDLYAHREQRVQLCQEPYDLANPVSFVGNWAQQRTSTNLRLEEYVQPLSQVATQHPQLVACWHRMHAIIADALEAAHLFDPKHFRASPGCMEIMGWDFVIEEREADGAWQPLLLEANHRPGFGWTRAFMERLIEQAIALVTLPMFPSPQAKECGDASLGEKVAHVEQPWCHVRTIIVHPDAGAAEQA